MEQDIESMRLFGEKVGIAFQVKDDLLDFGYEDIGKPRGIDIKEKKITLPLIYALNNAPKSERREMINLVKNHSGNPEKVKNVIQFVYDRGGIDYAEKVMQRYRDEAFDLLARFPGSSSRHSMEELVRFTIERKK